MISLFVKMISLSVKMISLFVKMISLFLKMTAPQPKLFLGKSEIRLIPGANFIELLSGEFC